jgi:hypothetical protein
LKEKFIIVFVFIFFVKEFRCFSQPSDDSTKYAKRYISVTGFSFYDDLYNYGYPGGSTGRLHHVYAGFSYGANIFKTLYGGIRLQYNYFRTVYAYSTENKHGFTGGPFIGFAQLNPKKVFYYNFKIHLLLSNIIFERAVYTYWNVRTDRLTSYFGTEGEIGFKLLPRLYVNAGISLNVQFGPVDPFNFPYVGIVVPVYRNNGNSKSVFNYSNDHNLR